MIDKSNAITTMNTDSPKNWKMSCVRVEPVVFFKPTSLALFDDCAVDKFMKLMHPKSKTIPAIIYLYPSNIKTPVIPWWKGGFEITIWPSRFMPCCSTECWTCRNIFNILMKLSYSETWSLKRVHFTKALWAAFYFTQTAQIKIRNLHNWRISIGVLNQELEAEIFYKRAASLATQDLWIISKNCVLK